MMKYAIPVLAAPLVLLAACSESPPEMPYGTPQQFMANHVQPTAEVYWNAVGSVSELVEGEPVFREFRPETDEDWAKVAAAAVSLREYGAAMATPAYADGRGSDWMAFAQGMQDVATLAEQAALNKDVDAVFEVGGTLYNVCTACHQVYPPAELPEGVSVDDMAADPNRPSADQSLQEYQQGEAN